MNDSQQLRPTAAPTLAAAGVVGLAIGGLVRPLVERNGGVAPSVTWTAPLTLFVFAVVLLALARSTYQTIHQQLRRIEPRRAVNLLVLGKASAVAGALVAGGYAGYALSFANDLETALPRERVTRSVVAALMALAVMVGGLLLERACRVPGVDDDDRGSGAGGVASGNSEV